MISGPADIGSQLGEESVASVVEKMEQFCSFEQQRLALVNESAILRLKAELSMLLEEQSDLEQKMRFAPPTGDRQRNRRRKFYAWMLGVLLIVAGFIFTILTFEPFRLGWKGWLYSLGIAVVTPFLVERLLDEKRMESLVKTLTAVAAVAGLTGLMFLAVIRGDLLAQQVQNNAPTVVIDDAQAVSPPPQNTFYDSTLLLLRIAMVLAAFAMELGAGLALREAWRMDASEAEDWDGMKATLVATRKRMAEIVQEVTYRVNEPRIFSARFYRDFYRSMLAHTLRNGMTRLLVLTLGLLLCPHGRAMAEDHLNMVIAIDLTQSVGVTGPDGESEFRKNIDGVVRVLAKVPAGSRVTVIGITDHSFAQPYILLSARVSDDPGYFGERLGLARARLVGGWKVRSKTLQPRFHSTDVIGALMLAGQILDQPSNANRKVLIIFSDMRHHMPDLDLESSDALTRLDGTEKVRPIPPNLRGVEVYILGADSAGRSLDQWRDLPIWTGFMIRSGALPKGYSILRDWLPQK